MKTALILIISFLVFGLLFFASTTKGADDNGDYAAALIVAEKQKEMTDRGCNFSCPYTVCVWPRCWNTNIKENGREEICDMYCVIIKLWEMKTGTNILKQMGENKSEK